MRDEQPRFLWWKDGANVVAALAVVAAVYVARSQLISANEQLRAQSEQLRAEARTASASYVLQLSEQLYGNRFKRIMNSIESHRGDFPLRKHGFNDTDIYDYIGKLETIGAFVHYGVVNDTMAYDEFSFVFERAYCNREIQAGIKDAREADRVVSGPRAAYINFTDLAERSLKQDRKECKDFDNE
jgi:hypothetical protein